jgi:iron(III) transport system substrate-binding protein
MNTGGRTRLALAGLAVVLAASGCGASPTAGGGKPNGEEKTAAEKLYDELGGMTGQQRRDELVKRAKKEGKLSLYTSMTSDIADIVTKSFTDQFGIDVDLYRAGSETVLQRILQEQSADYAGNDVVETNANELFALNGEGMLATYKGERRDLVPKAGQFDGWTATRFNLFAPSWNTNLVPAGEAPKTWEDLADPKWNGKLSMELTDSDWYLTLYEYWRKQGKSEQDIDKLFADMADGAKIVKGHTVQGELLSAGQFSVVASNYSYIVARAKDKGAPVDYLPFVEPVIARPNGVALMRSAEHPAAAMLFTDWLLTEGQKVLADDGLTPAIVEGDDPLKGVEIVPIDVKALVTDGEKWQQKYDKVVAGGEKVS